MTQEEILDVLQAEADRIWARYLELRNLQSSHGLKITECLNVEKAMFQMLAQHRQTVRIWERIFEGRWREEA